MQSELLTALTAAVVGAEGFLGSRLCRVLRDRGAVVLPFTRSRPVEVGGVVAPDVRHADVIFYLASSVTPGAAEAHPELAQQDHDALTRALHGIAQMNNRPTLVFASSSTSYDASLSPPYSEDDPTKPETVHGEIKLGMERTLLNSQGAVRPMVLRLASMYGPGHPMKSGHGVIAHWLHRMAESRPIDVIGDDGIRRDFIYVDDVVEAMVRVAVTCVEKVPSILNIGSGHPTSLAELLRKIIAATGIRPHINRHPTRSFDRRELWLDISRAKPVLGWSPRTPLETGLRETWKSTKSNVNK